MTIRKLASLLVVLAGLAGAAFGQTALTQTTLASAVSGPSFYNGNSSRYDGTVVLTSVTGISAPVFSGTPVSYIYVGREAMGVTAVNTSTKIVTVRRGDLGTQATPHPSGDMVIISVPVNTSNGGNPVPNGFFQIDPPQGAACTAANTPTTPWVNVLTGAQWLCSSVTGTWVPGFNNPLAPTSAGTTTAVASATTTTPSGPFFHLTGTTTVTTFGIPVGLDATASGYGRFCYINDSTAGTTAGNNIGATTTGTANTMHCWHWDAANSKFYPGP